MLEWVRLDLFIGLASVIVIITQLIKLAPVAVTSNYPKTVAWVVTAAVIGGIGYLQGASTELILAIMPVFALTAFGLYDVVSDIFKKFKK
jgi:hypothetical protein